MITNYNLGDWYWTHDSDGEVAACLYVARQGQFIIGVSEYMHCEGRIVDQLHEMVEKSQENEGVSMYLHYANDCYATREEAEADGETN